MKIFDTEINKENTNIFKFITQIRNEKKNKKTNLKELKADT